MTGADDCVEIDCCSNLVEATAESVQSAMDDFADSFSPRMTRSLADPPGVRSYPIAGYTYLIIHIDSMTDCLLATELVRLLSPQGRPSAHFVMTDVFKVCYLVLSEIILKIVSDGKVSSGV